MDKIPPRSLIFHVNKYQVRLILPILISIILIMILLGLFYYLSFHTTQTVYDTDKSTMVVFNHYLGMLEKMIPIILILLCILIVVLVYWIYYISNKLVGPFDRIVRELDQIMDGTKKKHPITVRKGDEMFDQLLKRVNQLIEKVEL
ncbi:MAG: hypothetical protein HQK77_13095 [Desulfobacterales bacterium]|nr:hypothetical protein [Desulfobacterales bacterium]